MLNPGESANCTRPNQTLALAEDRRTSLTTLAERVRALFEQLHTAVFRYLLRKTRDAGQAEDIAQETFLRLFLHLREDRLLDNPKAWLFTVANNLAIDVSRSEGPFKDLDETTWERFEESRASSVADPEKLALERDRMDRLHTAMLNLTA